MFSVETCPVFYGIFGTLAFGNKELLDASLDVVNATEPEKAAFEKVQDCYNEAGITSKLLDLLVMVTSSPCSLHHRQHSVICHIHIDPAVV